MSYFFQNNNPARSLNSSGRRGRRRPTGVSRRQKRRHLKFETLEDRRVMSATPATAGLEFTDSQVRELLLDERTLNEWADAADLSQYSDAQLANTTEWVILAAEGVSAGELAAATGVVLAGETGVVPWSYIAENRCDDSQHLVDALSNTELVDYYYPLVPFELESLATTNDEFLTNQWHLINFGQDTGNPDFQPYFGLVGEDINIEGAWDRVTGEGVVIGIVDSGVHVTGDNVHPDLRDNLRPDLAINLAGGGSNSAPTGNDAHGTAVAGLAAGVGNNSIGITGVAYEADIAPIRLFSDDPFAPLGVNDSTISSAFLYESQTIGVYNHSWGTPPPLADDGELLNPRTIIELGPLSTTALRNSVFFGRKVNPTDVNGLGAIHVFAAGNSRGIFDGGNYSELVNSRYTIGVTAVSELGGSTNYAESGAAALVAAPSGTNPLEIVRDEQLGSGIFTTDLLGDAGFNESPGLFGIETDADYQPNTDYSSRFNGTSASAPIVSGVIALMLEANPNLTYRDVQHILVRSSRQNAPNDESWITNNQQEFNDPLAFDSDGAFLPNAQDTIFDGDWPVGQPEQPSMPPATNTQVYYAQPTRPALFTNGSGFTVSQITGRTDNGFAHGVVDATLAVEMASNWVTLGGQTSEFTWGTGQVIAGQVNAAAVSSEETGEFRIPGSVVGDGNPDEPNAFIDFFDEFGEEDDPAVPDLMAEEPEDPDGPFSGDDPPVNTRGFDIGLTPPSMSVEWVEVELDLTADDANDYDFLRVFLVSPDGTQSELKNFHKNDVDHPIFHDIFERGTHEDPLGNITNDDVNLNSVFTTNRHWGERTEPKARLNTDGTDVRGHLFISSNPADLQTNKISDNNPRPLGPQIVDGWKLVFENFGDSAININSYEVAFHGVNTAGTGRIQGAVGVDDDSNGFFSDPDALADNFNRYTETNMLDALVDSDFVVPQSHPLAGLLNAQSSFPLSTDNPAYAIVASLDPYIHRDPLGSAQESWAAGTIVYADLNTNGQRDLTDPSYQIGHDGNYFFDLLPGTYDIRIDPNSLDAAGLLNQANLDRVNAGPLAVATITDPGERVSGSNVVNPLDGSSSYFGLTSIPELNIVLNPNAIPENIVNVSGFVYADLNGNDVKDGDDAPISGADVFIDSNQDGIYTPGFDILTSTAGDGSYAFVDQSIAPGFYSVVVLQGSTGSFGIPVNPAEGEEAFFFAPELQRENLNFGFELDGAAETGVITGVVFEDVNNNGQRGEFEPGLAGIATVYLDLNGNNMLDAVEPSVIPTETGTFTFNDMLPGSYSVRIEFDQVQYEQTTPAGLLNPDGSRVNEDNFESRITFGAGGGVNGVNFGLHNRAIADFGDLPSQFYPTTLSQNGARHEVSGDLFLGSQVDAELDAPATSNGFGDDTLGIDDEDGVVFSTLFDNSDTITATVTANTNGGFLQAWFDFNEDHIFEASELVIPEVLLNQGDTQFVIPVPANLTNGTVFARFRYGEQGIASFVGPALQGEVEDYAIPVVSTAIDPGVTPLNQNPDLDGDGDVDGNDFLTWMRGVGMSDPTHDSGDANLDGDVNGTDLAMLLGDLGQTVTSTSSAPTGDFDQDGDHDGADLLLWMRGVNTPLATLSAGDGNHNGTINGGDLQLWKNGFGVESGAAVAAAQDSGGSEHLLAAYSTPQTASISTGFSGLSATPRMIQPYFPEELGMGVADTTETTATGRAVDSRGFASLASEVERLADLNQQGESPTARLERSVDSSDSASSDLRYRIDAATSDRGVEQLYAQRSAAEEELLDDATAEDALAVALGEHLDWRL